MGDECQRGQNSLRYQPSKQLPTKSALMKIGFGRLYGNPSVTRTLTLLLFNKGESTFIAIA